MGNEPVLRIELAIKDRTIDTFTFTQDVVSIGRDPDGDIFIDNPGVSRVHTKVELVGGNTYVVKDQGSTNGTWLNNAKIHEEPLRTGDVIALGKFLMTVTVLKDEPRPVPQQAQESSDDIDGTTVLSKEQMAAMMASVKKEPGKPAAEPAKAAAPPAESSGAPVGLIVGGGIIAAIVIAIIVFLVMK